MTSSTRSCTIVAIIWLLTVSLITVAIFEHGQAQAARQSVRESVVLMDRALFEIQRSDSAVLQTLRLATQIPPGGCELLADVSGRDAFTSIEGDSWKIGPISTP
jgi:hypothetical protein